MALAFFDLIIFILSFGLLHASKNFYNKFSLHIFLGLIAGIGYGLLLSSHPSSHDSEFMTHLLSLIANGYLSLLKMLVIPLVLTSIIHSIVNLGRDTTLSMQRVSILTCGILLIMTAVASLITIYVGMLFSVGQGLVLSQLFMTPPHAYTGLTDALLGMLPSNPIKAMSQENTIAVVIFAVALGIAARKCDAKDKSKVDFFRESISSLFTIVKKLAHLVLSLTPYGIFALMALLIIDQGFELIGNMFTFVIAMYVAMLLVLLMHTLLIFMIGYAPLFYFKNAYAPLTVAFFTRSSFGTLPVTEETLREKFKVSETVSSFVPSIGSTIGMNACAGVFPAMLVVMAMNMLHQPITSETIVLVMLINAMASIGISGIPGTAYIAATVTLTTLNLPYAIIALVQGVDPIIDMGRTATNVNGVMTTALLVNRCSKKKRCNKKEDK